MPQDVIEVVKSAYGEMLKEDAPVRQAVLAKGRYELSAGGSTSFSAETEKSAGVSDLVPQYQIQRVLRPRYGKTGFNAPAIGNHPDFEYLRDTKEIEYHPITTLFMDMEGSTQLSSRYDLPTVAKIKDTFIQSTIEVVKSFDGHIHRIMGDAVMAYFGNRSCKPEMGIIDGLNCAALLIQLTKHSVIPKLVEVFGGTGFAIRVGLDHGVREDVLWSCYGYPGMCEITAQSFYVDIASKIQHCAGSNEIRIGESLRSQFDLHDELVPTSFPVAGNGYRQFKLDADRYCALSPVLPHTPVLLRAFGSNLAPLEILGTYHRGENGPREGDVISCGSFVPKMRNIAFRVVPPIGVRYPCVVKFLVENHGGEALRRGGKTYGNHTSLDYQIGSDAELRALRHWEESAYRGLHYLIAEIRTGNVVTHRGRFGVYVE
jgi:adenylate cyclase